LVFTTGLKTFTWIFEKDTAQQAEILRLLKPIRLSLLTQPEVPFLASHSRTPSVFRKQDAFLNSFSTSNQMTASIGQMETGLAPGLFMGMRSKGFK
jgi:hypothetical protein